MITQYNLMQQSEFMTMRETEQEKKRLWKIVDILKQEIINESIRQ